MIIAIPMAGLGSRFKDTHKEIKPLIDVNGQPMVKAVTACTWRDNPNRCQYNELWP